MLKALDVGRQKSAHLALNSVAMLEQWFNALPMEATVELYRDILPRLSDFLHLDEDAKPRTSTEPENDVFQSGLVVVDRKDIAGKVLDLLGKIGGHAHAIINCE
jgi:hypothetical protein